MMLQLMMMTMRMLMMISNCLFDYHLKDTQGEDDDDEGVEVEEENVLVMLEQMLNSQMNE